jgi:hypothetical protein
VLAGFGFTAAVIYMGQQGQSANKGMQDGQTSARKNAARSMHQVQTIALFTVSFIILGIDSWLFSVVAGNRPVMVVGVDLNVIPPPEPCGRVWSQALMAMGMLALGAIAMVCNITSLFLSQQLAIKDQKSRNYLRFFLLNLTGVAILGVITFLGADTLNYLDVVYNDHVPLWLTVATAIVTFGGLGIAMYVGGRSYFRKTASTPLKNRLRVPTDLILLYALVGTIAASAATRFPHWPDQPITWVIVIYWILGLIFPVVVVIWLAHGVPPGKPSLMASEHPTKEQPAHP